MADQKTTLEQMLEHLVNDNTAKAEELFHEYVVTKSREIYENLIEEEMEDEDVKEDSKDEEVDEASKDEDADEDKVDEASEKDEDEDEEKVDESSDEEVEEEFEEVAVEADDEMDAMGGDAGDDLESDITGDDEDGEKEPEELFQDLDSIVDELQAKFDEIKGGDEEAGDDMGDEMDDDKEEEMFAPEATEKDELETMREYVEKVAGGHGAETKGSAESADNKKSVVDNMKNDMGGTAANIAKGGESNEKNDGGLADINAKEDNAGNVNVPGAKGATKMSPEKGHGAEKKGAKENADNKQSIFRGRR